MMAERGVAVCHTTILRWVLRYVPEYEKRWARYVRPVSAAWRVDETAISIRGKNQYLYRAVDGRGKSVDHLLCADRSRDAAQAFFRKAVITCSGQWPRTVNLDGNAASHLALRLLGQEDARWRCVTVRDRQYLNNIIEQDHRAIKGRCASMLGFKSPQTAAITLSGIELAHRIRKGQFSIGGGSQRDLSLKQLWEGALSNVETTDRELTTQPSRLSTINAPELSGRGSIAHRDEKRGRRKQTARRPRKRSYGGGLYVLITPQGGQCWRYNYRFNGQHKTLALGQYPDISLEQARARHQAARRLLAAYGSRLEAILGDAKSRAELGPTFGPELTGAEVRYLMAKEWARFPDDILWRRSKLGLTMPSGDRDALATFMATGCREL